MDNAVVIGGLGVVGKATRKTFGIKDYFDLKGSTLNLEEAAQKRYIFICLPTPVKGEGHVHDISAIRDTIKQLKAFGGGKLYVVRSTTTPGQLDALCDELDLDTIIHNPEFLTMSSWKQDIIDPDIIVVGARLKRHGDEVVSLYNARYRGYPIHQSDLKTSEMIKLSINAFYSTKTIFGNILYDICTRLDIQYDQVQKALYDRKWIGKNHLVTPFNGKRGLRGVCLPKDFKAFTNLSGDKVFQELLKANKRWA
jgi:UDPglucose 6-dehydrogenase